MRKKWLASAMAAILSVSTVAAALAGRVEIAASSSSGGVDLEDGLIGYYTFDNTLANSVGTGSASLHGGAGTTWNTAATGSASYEVGVNGLAYDFTGNTFETTTENLQGTAWWTGSQTGQNYTMSGNGSLVLTVACTASVNNSAAFSVELVDDSLDYITTGSDGNAWYGGNATGSTPTGIFDTLNSTVAAGHVYTITVTRSGSNFTITYYDETSGTTYAQFGAANTNLANEVNVHIIAQVGSYTVTHVNEANAISGEGLQLDVTTGSDFTVGLWVNTSQKLNYQPILFAVKDATNYVTAGTYYNDYASGGIVDYNTVFYWLDRNNNSSSTLKDIPTDTWVYLTLTMTNQGVATLYYNGEVLSTQTVSNYQSNYYANMPIYLGINWWDASFDGRMDDVVVYNKALSATAVSALYDNKGVPVTEEHPTGLTNNLTGYYTFDNTLANSAASGQAALHGGAGDTWNAAVTGSATYAAGKNGNAYDFQGNSNGVSGNGLQLDVTMSSAYTISYWVNPDTVNSATSMVFVPIGTDSGLNIADNWFGATFPTVRIWGSQATSAECYMDNWVSAANALCGQWTYITVTGDANGNNALYINGQRVGTGSSTGGAFAGKNIFLGINYWDTSFDGKMDDVTIYNTALTADEVATLYCSGGNPQAAAAKEAAGDLETTTSHVSVHDPSIIKDPATGMYYVFGSHMAWAKSEDLIHWETFTNNINTNYETLFASDFAWAALGDSVYDPAGNLWAPDVIWNPNMQKWCMYMSINGCSWNSSIVLLTADSLEGNWTRVGTVVYSGMSSDSYVHKISNTDYTQVTGESTLNSRYITTGYYCKDNNTYTSMTDWNYRYGTHAIDPCVLYDDNGNLWMSYGSWSGGISMIRLNNNTGLRDYSVTYPYVSGVSDPYTGYKLAGGSGVSGEASYIQKIGDYYYMYVSYGGFTANGGYNMRIFRSENINGPYVDYSGDDARYPNSTRAGVINGSVGVRLMSYYKWSYMDYGYCAQGHNSCFVDDDGKAYVIYHTRYNDGTETHRMMVHQLFVTEDGWLAAAPFEYTGESLTSYMSDADVTGTYEVLFQSSTDYTNLECAQGVQVTLNADGTVTGAKSGSWAWSSAKGAPYVNITLNGITYKGVFVEQQMEEADFEKTMAFTLIGSDELCVWGYKL